jgi:hypothetical protein
MTGMSNLNPRDVRENMTPRATLEPRNTIVKTIDSKKNSKFY